MAHEQQQNCHRPEVTFHRSYALQNQGECNQQDLDDFYQENSQKIRQHYQRKQQQDDNSDEYNNGNEEEEEWELENFSGNFQSDERRNGKNNNSDYGCDDDDDNCNSFNNNQKNGKNQKNGRKQGKKISPVKKTKVVEMNHDICFSKEPVKQCPRGTVPSDRTTSDFGSSSSSNSQQDDDDENAEGETKNVPYICMNRSISEARRLLRQFRQGQRVLNVQSHGHSMVLPTKQPRACRRA